MKKSRQSTLVGTLKYQMLVVQLRLTRSFKIMDPDRSILKQIVKIVGMRLFYINCVIPSYTLHKIFKYSVNRRVSILIYIHSKFESLRCSNIIIKNNVRLVLFLDKMLNNQLEVVL